MRNNKGFAKFEVITIVVILLVVFAFLFYVLLNGTGGQKYTTMKENASSFAKSVAMNIESFHYTNTVYLEEAIDEGVFNKVKNPFGSGNCDTSESKIETIDGKAYATLRCGKYLLEKEDFSNTKNIPFYEIGEWTDKKPEGEVEEKELYNCLDNDKEVFDQYYEELYFVYQFNKKYEEDAYFANDVNNSGICEVTTKTFYRTRKEIGEK